MRGTRSITTAFAALAGAFSPIAGAHSEPLALLPGHISPAASVAHPVGALGDQPMSLAISLPIRDPNGLKNFIDQAYNPSSSTFGHYLTPSEFADRYGPTAADYQAVTDFARSQGLTVQTTHANRLVLDVSGPSSAIASTFHVNLNRYIGADGKAFFAPDREPSLPASIAARVQSVIGLSSDLTMRPQYMIGKPKGRAQVYGTGFLGDLSPYDVNSAYNLLDVPQTGKGQVLGVFELDGYTPSDIATYTSYYGLRPIPLQNILVDGFPGQPTAFGGDIEVDLDVELLNAVAPGASKILVYEAPPEAPTRAGYVNQGVSVVDLLSRMATDNLANEISISWGYPETQVAPATLAAENAIFQEMAAQGQSVFAASGDNGAFADGYDLGVLDPGAQPYLTGVGGTTLYNTPFLTYAGETSWNELENPNGPGGAGGGGISQFWPIPSYQLGSVSEISGASSTNRNVPDVSLNADPYTGYSEFCSDPSIFSVDGWTTVGGTSAAAPLWSAFTARVNQARYAAKTAPIGFLNPAIYKLAATGLGFHDIADASYNGSYPAVPGYDLSTGLGSYDGAELLYFLSGSPSTVTPLPIPILSGKPVNAGVNLTWFEAGPATSYTVYRSKSATGGFVAVATVTSKSYSDTGLTNGVTYYYEVRAAKGAAVSGLNTPYAVTPVPVFAFVGAPHVQVTANPYSTPLLITWTTTAPSTTVVTLFDTTYLASTPLRFVSRTLTAYHAYTAVLTNFSDLGSIGAKGDKWTYTVQSSDGAATVSSSGKFVQP